MEKSRSQSYISSAIIRYSIHALTKTANMQGWSTRRSYTFPVTLTEMETTTGRSARSGPRNTWHWTTAKWRVCLGYKDLKRVIQKFKYLAETLGKIDREEIIERALPASTR